MHLKVHDGTPLHDDSSLCTTCRNARITRGRALNEELVVCRASHLHADRILFRVKACSAYSDEREPSYFELMNSRRGFASRVAAASRQASSAPPISATLKSIG